MRIALTGNPNSGKTTMYNALTGRNEKIGNWAGVTVAKKESQIKKAYYDGSKELIAVDLPGAYSMSPFTSEESITSGYVKNEHPDVIINIVDATNIGAIFRSAAALHMDAVLVTPSCCDPLNRRAVRVSMGTVFQVPWTRIGNDPSAWPQPGIARLHRLGFQVAAMALNDKAISIEDPRLLAVEKLAIVLGTEGDGLAPRTIADCDYTVCIPMSHGVDSLNVAAASAVAFWQLRAR